ncbi:MAG: SCP2 sterol-binding domain-containing protein, partial [Solirubrobacterales bacterium]
AVTAAAAHDHEQAAAHMRSVLALLPEAEPTARAPALLELGEQELLTADLVRARQSFRGAVEAARATGDAGTLARAALGFAGGDIGFGWEAGTDDPSTVMLLREGLEALGDSEPRLGLRMTFRLAYLLVFTDDDDVMPALVRRAEELAKRLGDAESRVLARFTGLVARFARHPDPGILGLFEEFLELLDLAEGCDREDLLFRVVQWSAVVHYVAGRIPECEQAIERGGEIAQRLGSPRFTWEVDLNRGQRLMDRGDREAGEALIRRAGAVVRRLRPDIHMVVELSTLTLAEWTYDGETATMRIFSEANEAVAPRARGFSSAFVSFAAAADGDLETARRRMWALLTDDLEPLRCPDGHMPAALCLLAHTATFVGDREAGARLRPLLEPMRHHLVPVAPAVASGHLPEWHIGRLELLADRPDAAVEELRTAVAKADALEMVAMRAWTRVDLARALHRRSDPEEAQAVLAEGEAIAERYGLGWVTRCVAQARAEMEDRELPAPELGAERTRPIRAMATRGGRRALTAMARGLDDADLERRFAEPSRQRALLKAMARGFQPAQAGGFSGVIAYELEPFAIEPPPEAPWRWAIEVDSGAGHARLLEPAPLDAAVTIHFGLADWVRVVAGMENPLTAMVAGRCSVEGDVTLAVRLEAMFGAQ